MYERYAVHLQPQELLQAQLLTDSARHPLAAYTFTLCITYGFQAVADAAEPLKAAPQWQKTADITYTTTNQKDMRP